PHRSTSTLTRAAAAVLLATALLAGAPASADIRVLTHGKLAHFDTRGAPDARQVVVAVARDPELRTLLDPRCPTQSVVELEVYPQSTLRLAVLAQVELDCAKWSARGAGFEYVDPSGTVRAVYYRRTGLR